MCSSNLKPLVGVIGDFKTMEPHKFHVAGDKYLRALSGVSNVVPVIIPSLLSDLEIKQWLSRLDGLLLTGAYSMIEPALYGEARIARPYEYDSYRDELTQNAVRSALALDLPMFGICRGLQDINIAMEGSLYQAVQDMPNLIDHREDKTANLNVQYGDAHEVSVVKGGLLYEILEEEVFTVNSLHTQGIKSLGSGLVIEAQSGDGLIEAISIKEMSFGLAVQWHPEWKVQENLLKKKLFKAFGRACRRYQSTYQGGK